MKPDSSLMVGNCIENLTYNCFYQSVQKVITYFPAINQESNRQNIQNLMVGNCMLNLITCFTARSQRTKADP